MSDIVWSPQPKQALFMSRPEDEALYGGSAGGGKSDALVIEALRQVHIPYYKGLIVRKTFPQLSELIDKSLNYYSRAFPKAKYNATNHTWTFPSGAKIIFGSMHTAQSKLQYQGQSYDFIAFDELTHFTYDEYIYLLSRNRPNGSGTRCYMRATANPGGIGHSWVKERFITAAPPMQTVWEDVDVRYPDGHTERKHRSRIFVPSTVFDNQILLDNDPEYIARLASMPEAERNALLYGDWNSYSGQVFKLKDDPAHYIDRQWTHVIEPFEVPSNWTIYRSYDHGYHKPFSVGWTAISEDDVAYRILEWYGCTNTPDTGLEMIPDEIFERIRQIESEHRWLKGKKIIGVADPAIWGTQTGVSVAETAAKHGIYFQKGDNSRLDGWLQCQYRLAFSPDGYPMFYVFNTCKAFIRTVPALVYDENRAEDVDTSMEDHQADEWRYFCQARKILPRRPAEPDKYYQSPLYTALGIEKGDLPKQTYRPKMTVIEE